MNVQLASGMGLRAATVTLYSAQAVAGSPAAGALRPHWRRPVRGRGFAAHCDAGHPRRRCHRDDRPPGWTTVTTSCASASGCQAWSRDSGGGSRATDRATRRRIQRCSSGCFSRARVSSSSGSCHDAVGNWSLESTGFLCGQAAVRHPCLKRLPRNSLSSRTWPPPGPHRGLATQSASSPP
jgi:hypothetical protein